MNHYLLLPLVQTVCCLALIVVVLKGHSRSFIHRLFSIDLLVLAIWGVVIFGMRASPDIEHAYSWEKWLVPLGSLMSVLLYHFSVRFTVTKVKNWVLPLLYVIWLVFIPLTAMNLVFSGMQTKPYGYAPLFGPAASLWVLFTYIVSIMALATLIRSYTRSLYAEERNRIAYIITGITLTFIGGAFDLLPVLGLPLYPGGIISSIIFCLLTTIAIVKYRLLDIRVALRKSVAYILTSTLIAVPFIGVFLLFTRLLAEAVSAPWAYFVLLVALAFALPQLWRRVQQWVDRWYYRDRYDYLKSLETFSRDTQSLRDSATLGLTMVRLISGALRTASVHLLQPLPSSGDFTTTFSTGLNNVAPGILLRKQNSLVKWLARSKGMLSYEDIDIIPQLQGMTSKERESLQQIGAKLVIPLKTHNGPLSGLLILGPKLSEEPYSIEDKQLIYAMSSQAAINLENAQLYNTVQREVAERKRAEQALREAGERHRIIFEQAADSIVLIDVDTGALVEFNHRAHETLGYSREEFEKLKIPDFEVIESTEEVMKHMEKVIKEGSDIFETQHRTKGGEIRDVLVNSKAICIGGKTFVQSILRDITERKRVEEREKQLQEELYVSSKLAAIGELAAGVAHEINNPLTGILGFSERLLRKSTDGKLNRDLAVIHNEARRAAKVVEMLLTFARRHEPKKEYSDVNDIVQRAVELRAYELKTTNIGVSLDLAPTLPKTTVDFHQLQEVFLNLILNAEQAMSDTNQGGNLSIKTQLAKDYIRISFADDGPGIPVEHVYKVFDPFFTTRGGKGGTGLGLSVCHGIVAEHGGKIYVRSKPGRGATFFVELPMTTEDEGKVSEKECVHGSK